MCIQRGPIGQLFLVADHPALKQAELKRRRSRNGPCTWVVGHVAQGIERWQDRDQVRIPHRAGRDQGCLFAVAHNPGLRVVQHRKIAQIAARPERADAERHDYNRCIGQSLGQPVAPLDLVIGGHKSRLFKDHVVEQLRQKERPPGPPPRANGLTANAKGARHAHHQTVNRRAFLRAGCEIHPAQHLAVFVFVVLKQGGQEIARHGLHGCDLRRETSDHAAALRVSFGLNPL